MKKYSRSSTYLLVIVSIIWLLLLRNVFIAPDTHLVDWLDFPYYVWTIAHNHQKFLTLDFTNYFTTNAFYPNEKTLLFSDLLIPQSLISMPIAIISDNPILIFNLTLIFTLIMNGFGAYFLWKQIFSEKTEVFVATIFTSFSPFVFMQFGHFQMITLWPMLLALGLQFKKSIQYKDSIFIGILITIQFLASVYLALFLLTILGLFWLLQMAFSSNNSLIAHVKNSSIVLGVFFLSCSYFIIQYKTTQNDYAIQRSYGEYVLYAAHPSDYFFTGGLRSYSATLPFIRDWNHYNKHAIGEPVSSPGILLSLLAVYGLIVFFQNKNYFGVQIDRSKFSLFFILVGLTGFLFSLGPKLSVNGSFTGIPLPYALIMKIVPIVEPIRATSRWSLLFYLAVTYFSVKGFRKFIAVFPKYQNVLTILILIIFFIDNVPMAKGASKETYYPEVYQVLSDHCDPSKILLEYPINQNAPDANVATNLSYKTKQLLASIHHGCTIVNGYAGFDPKSIQELENTLHSVLDSPNEFNAALASQQVDFLKINKRSLYPDDSRKIESLTKNHRILENNEEYLIVQMNYD